MAVRVEGMADAIRLMRQFPGNTKRNQNILIFQSARELQKGIRKRLRATVPTRSGATKRRLGVRTLKRPPTVVISSGRGLVPANQSNGYLSKELNKLPSRMDAEVVEVIQKRITKLQEGSNA